jgi:L-amino acid N-acyltransferase
MEVKIRAAKTDDLQNILNIINQAIIHTTALYDYEPRSYETQKIWFEKKISDDMPVIVAEYENQAIGFGTYGIFRPREGYKFSIEHSIYISEKFRSRGVGKKILEELIILATEGGYHTMIAGIDADNLSSYEFHKKYGFKEAGRFHEVGYKFNKWLDVVFMQLMLKNK